MHKLFDHYLAVLPGLVKGTLKLFGVHHQRDTNARPLAGGLDHDRQTKRR